MATTCLIPLHRGKGRSVHTAISSIIDYAENPEKTDKGIARIEALGNTGGGNLMKNEMNRSKIFPITMAALWGIVFANAMHSWTLGICMGLCMGIAFGLFDSDRGENEDE